MISLLTRCALVTGVQTCALPILPQSVSIAVSVLGASALEDHLIDDIDDLQNVVPTLSVSAASGRPNAPVYSLRGIRPTEAIYGQDPTVAIYFDDVVLSTAQGSNLGMYDLSSVKVLKGPQGNLFGSNRSESHTSELQSLKRISYAVFCSTKKN